MQSGRCECSRGFGSVQGKYERHHHHRGENRCVAHRGTRHCQMAMPLCTQGGQQGGVADLERKPLGAGGRKERSVVGRGPRPAK